MKNKLNQINQFNGGMIKDVEPLMVPNTVMTDCLNGTLITYNGNEFALQNDMGNYGFKMELWVMVLFLLEWKNIKEYYILFHIIQLTTR